MIYAKASGGDEPKPFAFLSTSDGVRLRYGIWSASAENCRGTVLLLAGRSEYMEKYAEVIQELNTRGFDVVSFDWRGQGLSQRLLAHPTKGYVAKFEQYLLDIEAVLGEFLPRCRGQLKLLAHSMGGHLALRYLYKRPGLFSKVVLCAPMIDINTAPMPKHLARLFSRFFRTTGFARAMIAGAHFFDPYGRCFEENQLTSDPQRYEQIQRTLSDNPSMSAAHVTNGWLAAAFDSIDILRRPGFNSGIHTPLLIVTAGQDQIVVNRATLEFASELPCCQMTAIEGSRHEILQEQDVMRSQFWQAFDGFVDGRPTPQPDRRNLFPDTSVR